MCTEELPFLTSLKTPPPQHKEITAAGQPLGDSNLVFDELHRRVLKIQLIAQPHEKAAQTCTLPK